MRVEMLMGNKKSEKFVLTNEGGLLHKNGVLVLKNEEIEDRYVSFKNIDCYKHASEVVDCVIDATKDERYNNPFWDAFKAKIPQAYYDKAPDEKVLYLVCASVFYIEELFEESEHERGLAIMKKCEYECC